MVRWLYAVRACDRFRLVDHHTYHQRTAPIMRKLLLRAFMAVASEAHECVRERAAMIEEYSGLCAMGHLCFAARHIG